MSASSSPTTAITSPTAAPERSRTSQPCSIVYQEVGLASAHAPVKVLVVGSLHGTEPGGHEVVARLRRAHPPRGVALWLVDDLNPDGTAARRRQNAHGVDLNRNFPYRWEASGRPGSA